MIFYVEYETQYGDGTEDMGFYIVEADNKREAIIEAEKKKPFHSCIIAIMPEADFRNLKRQ